MKPSRHLLIIAMFVLAAQTATAGVFFNRHPKTNANDQVPVLIGTVKTDPDDHKRSTAAQQLRDYDPAAHPEVVPILIDVAQHDPKPGVRSEAVQSLAKLRPISQEAGQAIEQVAEHDASLRVRLQAKTALWQYKLNGYHTLDKKDVPSPSATSNEPPLADPAGQETSPSAGIRRVSPPLSYVTQPVNAPRLTPVAVPNKQAPPTADDNGPDLVPPGN
jgi:hypothetical protein